MPMRRINVTLSGTAFVSFLVREKEKEVTSDIEKLKKIGILIRSCMDKCPGAGDIYLASFQAEVPDASSVLNLDYLTKHSIAFLRAGVLNVFPNKIITYSPWSLPISRASLPELPKLSIQITDAPEVEVHVRSPQLFTDIIQNDTLGASHVSFKPSLTPEIELPHGITIDEVNNLLHTTGKESFVVKQGAVEAIFTKLQLSIFPYFIPQLVRLLSDNTKKIIEDVLNRKKEYEGVINVIKAIANNAEINKLASHLPINDNIWQNFLSHEAKPLIARVEKKKNELKPEEDLQALLNGMSEKLLANAKHAVADKDLILMVKTNFIRALHVTVLSSWVKLNSLANSDPQKASRMKAFKDFIDVFDARIVIEGSKEYMSFSAEYFKKNVLAIAEDVNKHIQSEFRAELIKQLVKCGNKDYFVIHEKSIFAWTKSVMNAHNPVVLQQEDKALQASVELFFANCDKNIKDQSLQSETLLIDGQVDRIKNELVKIKSFWSALHSTLQKIKAEIRELKSQVTKYEKDIADQQALAVNLSLDLQEPKVALLELQSTFTEITASHDIIQNHLIAIGSAQNSDDALKESKAAETEFATVHTLKETFNKRQAAVDQAVLLANTKIHEKRVDNLLRQNLGLLKEALYDVSFWHKHTKKFLCIGGTTVIVEGETTKVPLGIAEMIEVISALELMINLSILQILDALTKLLKIAHAAIERGEKMFFNTRETPTQNLYQEIVNKINVNLTELLNNKEIPNPINLDFINPKWSVKLAEEQFRRDLSTTHVNSENSREYSVSNSSLSDFYSIGIGVR